MGELIRFRPRQGAKTEVEAARVPLSGEGATILLFTGVRYERHEDPQPAKTPRPAGRGGRRKRA